MSIVDYLAAQQVNLGGIMQEFFLGSVYIAVVVAFIWVGVMLHKSNSSFSVTDVFVDTKTGRASTSKIFAVIAGVTSTWFMFWATIKNVMTPEYFGIYLITWSGSKALSDWMKLKAGSKEESKE